MESLVKREVNISLTAHIDMVSQMVLDGYEVACHRFKKNGNLRLDDAIYHRFMRQTGHTSAMKRILSEEFQEAHQIKTWGLYHSTREKNSFHETGSNFSIIGRPETLIGIPHDINVLIVSDTLHDGKRLTCVQNFIIHEIREKFNELRLVVFLG